MKFQAQPMTPLRWLALGLVCIASIGLFNNNAILVLSLAAAAMFCFAKSFLVTEEYFDERLTGQLPKKVINKKLRTKQIDTCFLSIKEAKLLGVSLARAETTGIPTLMLNLSHQGGVCESLNPNGDTSVFDPGILKVAFSSLNGTLDDPQQCQKLEDWRLSGEARDWYALESATYLKPRIESKNIGVRLLD